MRFVFSLALLLSGSTYAMDDLCPKGILGQSQGIAKMDLSEVLARNVARKSFNFLTRKWIEITGHSSSTKNDAFSPFLLAHVTQAALMEDPDSMELKVRIARAVGVEVEELEELGNGLELYSGQWDKHETVEFATALWRNSLESSTPDIRRGIFVNNVALGTDFGSWEQSKIPQAAWIPFATFLDVAVARMTSAPGVATQWALIQPNWNEAPERASIDFTPNLSIPGIRPVSAIRLNETRAAQGQRFDAVELQATAHWVGLQKPFTFYFIRPKRKHSLSSLTEYLSAGGLDEVFAATRAGNSLPAVIPHGEFRNEHLSSPELLSNLGLFRVFSSQGSFPLYQAMRLEIQGPVSPNRTPPSATPMVFDEPFLVLVVAPDGAIVHMAVIRDPQ